MKGRKHLKTLNHVEHNLCAMHASFRFPLMVLKMGPNTDIDHK